MRGTNLRSLAGALAVVLGIATVGVAGANPTTSARAASGAATLGTVHLGMDAAMLLAQLDRPADRVSHRRSVSFKWAVAMVVLVSVGVLGAALARWLLPFSEVAGRSRALPWRAPQRAPPPLPLALL